MSDAGNWCLIESDPGVFTELLWEFGVEGAQVEEVWSLDAENMKTFKMIEDDEPAGSIVQDSRLDKIFFAKQVVNNACATQALLSILMNTQHSDLKLGQTLTDFKEFCQSFDPTMKGFALSNSQPIRNAHNSFARHTVFEFDSKSASKDDDLYHFISYVPIDGRVYELDGLKEGPVDLGAIPPEKDWIEVVQPIISEKMNKYSSEEIRFNLMAVVSDKKFKYERELTEASNILESNTLDAAAKAEKQTQIAKLKMLIEAENAKLKKYKVENSRRKHNYLPLIMGVLKNLAERGELMNVYNKAVEIDAMKKSNKVKHNL